MHEPAIWVSEEKGPEEDSFPDLPIEFGDPYSDHMNRFELGEYSPMFCGAVLPRTDDRKHEVTQWTKRRSSLGSG